MWYIGGDRFIDGPAGKRLPLYGLRRTSSPDGIHWSEQSLSIREPDLAHGEIGFGRPFIWSDEAGGHVMYVARRGHDGYRLISAVSSDLEHWTFSDEEPIPRGAQGWDSEMICYGAVCRSGGETWLFYNGNGFGRTGFGVAVLETRTS